MLTNRRVIVAKIESVEGTEETLTAADGGILAFEPKVDVDIKMNERKPAMSTLSRLFSVPGGQAAKISFKAEMKGSGLAYTSLANAPVIGKFLKGCGFAETLAAGSGVITYTPAASGTLTIGCYEDGVVKKIVGARGNVKFSGKVGGVVMAEFEFDGVWAGITDGSMLSPTYQGIGLQPPVLLSANMSIAGYAAIVSGFDIDMANEKYLREHSNGAAGYLSCVITGRKPNGKIDPEMVAIATHDWFGRWKAGTSGVLNIGNIGASLYNRFKITAPKAVYTKVSDADRSGQAVADTSFELAMDAGDDELEIEFS